MIAWRTKERMTNGAFRIALTATAALSAMLPISTAAQTIAIQNARIHTLTGAEFGDVVENGDILVRDGLIVAVGRDISVPEGATIIDAGGQVVTPGIMAPWSQLGLLEIWSDEEANDAVPKDGFPYGASLEARDAYNPSSTLIPVSRASGITRAVSVPSAGASLFAGQAMVIDLSSGRQSITRPLAAQFAAMGYQGAARAGGTRLGSWLLLRETLDAVVRYADNPRKYAAQSGDERFTLADLRALRTVVSGEQPLVIAVNSDREIRKVIQLKRDYGLNVIVFGGREAWRVGREIAAAEIPVIIDPLANLPSSFESLGSTLLNAARLHEAGVLFAFSGPGSHHVRHIPKTAGNAVANGLPYSLALAAMTIAPATMYGLEDRLGSLEPGKIADIVVWTGDPLELNTRPSTVIINGQLTSLTTRQTKLLRRYRDLSRGNLPFAYRGE